MASILIVDDEESMRITLSMLLKREGYNVTIASGGEDALRKIQTGISYDLVITDLTKQLGTWLRDWVPIINTINLSSLENNLCIYFGGPESGCGIGGEERVPGPTCKYYNPPLIQVFECSVSIKRFIRSIYCECAHC